MRKNIKIITKHWSEIDPLKIGDYLRAGGYQALRKFVTEMGPEKAIEEIKISKLCGRGGAGFPTGEKFEQVSGKKGMKFLICNLEESEPGTYKDRAIIDNNPHLLLEGIIISAIIIGSAKAFIYINGNYEKQKGILEIVLKQAERGNFLGERILGSNYSLEVELFSGAGAYVSGEETALINSMEGNRGEPKARPPYPTEAGLFGKPTVINNAETLANIPWIIANGGKKYSEIGSAQSPGTKLFILSGAVKNRGIFEAPTGITIKDLIDNYGGGIQHGKEFWFAQIDGANGRLIMKNELDQSLDYAKSRPCPLGSGSILAVDKTANIYDLLLSWTEFFKRESCGKCVPCREGTFRLYEITKRLSDEKISDRDKTAIQDILWTLENTTFCPFGQFAATAFQDAVKKLRIF